MTPRVPVTLLTGFLGAGKTTVLRALLESADGGRLGVMVNEFGSVGVDGALLESCSAPGCAEGRLIELANGCVCCAVADDFAPSLLALLDLPDPPTHIVVETSGLALPKPVLKAFDWPELRGRATVDGVIAVIDAPATAAGQFAEDEAAIAAQRAADPQLDHDQPLVELFEEQVACADVIVLNKLDGVDAAGEAAARAAIDQYRRAGAAVIGATRGQAPARALLGLGLAVEDDLDARPGHGDHAHDHHDHDDFDSAAIDLGEIDDPAAFEARLSETAEKFGLLRAKGFLAVTGKPLRRAVQAVGGRVDGAYDGPFRGARVSRLVVIGFHGMDVAGIAAHLQQAR